MTTCVSGGICMSRSSLRLGASEGESDALLGKGSGSHRRLRKIGHLTKSGFRGQRPRRAGECAEQAVALQASDRHRQHLSDDIGRGHHMRGLQIGGAADEDRKSTRLNSRHGYNSYAVLCLKKKKSDQSARDKKRKLLETKPPFERVVGA